MTQRAREAAGWTGAAVAGVLLPLTIFWADAMHDEVRGLRTEIRSLRVELSTHHDKLRQRVDNLTYRVGRLEGERGHHGRDSNR
jgi:hypothetical protein